MCILIVWFRTFHAESVMRSTKKYQYFCRETLNYNINLMELVKLQYYKEISIKYYTLITSSICINDKWLFIFKQFTLTFLSFYMVFIFGNGHKVACILVELDDTVITDDILSSDFETWIFLIKPNWSMRVFYCNPSAGRFARAATCGTLGA